ncbi:MAG TPA: hypothetical protein EYQ73_07405 [Candidatus Poseidoniales archaeon]|jgi:hypothetical protein|nr:MAG: hypothetical protein CXT71_06965 [Euryarchaeota archaeon]HIF46596.1 hypothetical protein [Candidatus Poseidoniales archaeon]HIL65737.1 hypothetical protein [Candidatus Poseidoniales archaeon]
MRFIVISLSLILLVPTLVSASQLTIQIENGVIPESNEEIFVTCGEFFFSGFTNNNGLVTFDLSEVNNGQHCSITFPDPLAEFFNLTNDSITLIKNSLNKYIPIRVGVFSHYVGYQQFAMVTPNGNGNTAEVEVIDNTPIDQDSHDYYYFNRLGSGDFTFYSSLNGSMLAHSTYFSTTYTVASSHAMYISGKRTFIPGTSSIIEYNSAYYSGFIKSNPYSSTAMNFTHNLSLVITEGSNPSTLELHMALQMSIAFARLGQNLPTTEYFDERDPLANNFVWNNVTVTWS